MYTCIPEKRERVKKIARGENRTRRKFAFIYTYTYTLVSCKNLFASARAANTSSIFLARYFRKLKTSPRHDREREREKRELTRFRYMYIYIHRPLKGKKLYSVQSLYQCGGRDMTASKREMDFWNLKYGYAFFMSYTT